MHPVDVESLAFDLFAGMGGLAPALESLVDPSSCCVKIIMFATDAVAREVLSKGVSKTGSSRRSPTTWVASDQSSL